MSSNDSQSLPESSRPLPKAVPAPQEIRHTSVIGAGTIGASWAALFLANGLSVTLNDPAPEAETLARTFIEKAWPALVTLGIAGPDIPWSALRIEPDLEKSVANADFVQENAPEREDFKVDLYARIDAAAPVHAILASSTSGLHMSRVQSRCVHPERCVVGHPFNPPHLIPLVEVVAGDQTSADTIDRAVAFYRGIGKRPIRVNKEVTGHVANRLQAAVWREAIYLAMQGVASIEDIDTAMTEGPGLRWAIFGPHMTFNLGGGQGGMGHFLDQFTGPMQTWWDDLGDVTLDDETRRVLLEGLAQESHGRTVDELAHQRDEALLRVLNAKKNSES